MLTWVELWGRFTEEEQQLLEDSKVIFKALPDIFSEQPVSCYQVAEAFARHFNLPRVTGYFGEIYEHSWLIAPGGNILDVYPVGVLGGPVLVACVEHEHCPGRVLYKENRDSWALARVLNHREFEPNVAILLEAIAKAYFPDVAIR